MVSGDEAMHQNGVRSNGSNEYEPAETLVEEMRSRSGIDASFQNRDEGLNGHAMGPGRVHLRPQV